MNYINKLGLLWLLIVRKYGGEFFCSNNKILIALKNMSPFYRIIFSAVFITE